MFVECLSAYVIVCRTSPKNRGVRLSSDHTLNSFNHADGVERHGDGPSETDRILGQLEGDVFKVWKGKRLIEAFTVAETLPLCVRSFRDLSRHDGQVECGVSRTASVLSVGLFSAFVISKQEQLLHNSSSNSVHPLSDRRILRVPFFFATKSISLKAKQLR